MIFIALVATVGGGSLVGMRGGRGKVGQRHEIKPGIYGVKSGSATYLYARKRRAPT